MSNWPSLMVTGTDTGVGKTVVTALLTRIYQKKDLKVVPFKPVATGSLLKDGKQKWPDIDFLAKSANVSEDIVGLYKFQEPLSPHLAASKENKRIEIGPIISRFQTLEKENDAVIVEGVGGLLVPLNENDLVSDLAVALNLPVIIATRFDLGTLNHTMLTVEAGRQRGLSIAGLIINRYPDKPDEVQKHNPAELQKLTGLPLLGIIPEIKGLSVEKNELGDIENFTKNLDISQFLEKLATYKKNDSYNKAIEADKKHVWHPFTPMREYLAEEPNPLMIVEADGCYLKDSNGNKYLDGISSLWVNIYGHRKKELDEAIKKQLSKVAHSTLLGLANEPSALLAEELAKITPLGLNRVFYSDSGSTAVEIALKVAFQYFKQTGRPEKQEFISFVNAYHGDTIGSVSIGGIGLFHSIFKELLFESHQVPLAPLNKLEQLLEERKDKIAAVVLEPLVQGAAGMIVQPAGNLKRITKLCKKNDVLLIVDEVATGFGRTGKMFACEHENIKPDIMALAKGITGGYLPLAATLFTEEIYQAFLGSPEENKTFFHGHTYTGNPLACAVALVNLKLLQQDNFLVEVQEKAQYLAGLLKPLNYLTHVGSIRQCGLMVGIELVANKENDQHFLANQRIGHRVILKARQRGVIIRPLGDVIVLMPPLAINKEELKQLVDVTSWAIQEITEIAEPVPKQTIKRGNLR